MFPEGLITGSMPPSLLSSREGDAVRKLDHLSRQPTTNLQTPIQSLKHSLEREDVEKLEINLSNMMRTSVASGSSLSSRISEWMRFDVSSSQYNNNDNIINNNYILTIVIAVIMIIVICLIWSLVCTALQMICKNHFCWLHMALWKWNSFI